MKLFKPNTGKNTEANVRFYKSCQEASRGK